MRPAARAARSAQPLRPSVASRWRREAARSDCAEIPRRKLYERSAPTPAPPAAPILKFCGCVISNGSRPLCPRSVRRVQVCDESLSVTRFCTPGARCCGHGVSPAASGPRRRGARSAAHPAAHGFAITVHCSLLPVRLAPLEGRRGAGDRPAVPPGSVARPDGKERPGASRSGYRAPGRTAESLSGPDEDAGRGSLWGQTGGIITPWAPKTGDTPAAKTVARPSVPGSTSDDCHDCDTDAHHPSTHPSSTGSTSTPAICPGAAPKRVPGV